MRSNILLTLFLAFALSLSVLAKDVNRAQAEKVAVNFFFERSNIFSNTVDYYDLSITEVRKVDDAYYVVNFENGWVLVAADDAMVPVLGYNYQGKFVQKELQDYNVRSYLQHFVEQIDFIRENNLTADDEVLAQWERYQNSDPETLLSFRGSRDQLGPLLTGRWNQDYPYNILCPEDNAGPGGHVYVGCVATAMSLIMHYWRYPLQGSGSFSYYQYPYGTLSFDYGEAYFDYNAMQDVIDGANPWEVAEIGYAAAVSVEMDFAPDGSGAYSQDVPYALETYFNYDNDSRYVQKSSYSDAAWINMIQGDLDLGHAIYYSGRNSDNGGHAFVCDGYNSDDYFHFNFGWGGSNNGFFTLSDVGGFYINQAMVYQIYPEDPDYPYIPDEQVVLTAPSGSFTDGSGPVDNYPSGWNGSWLIDPQTETDSIVDITLTFIQFNTASSDFVRVYDGGTTSDPLLGEFSGDELPGNITSSGNKMLITFTTSGTGEGFKAEYTTQKPTYCQAQEFFTDPSGTISDGSGTFNYNSQTSCIYIIQHPEAVNFSLEFTNFATEEGKDVVTIYNGDQDMVAELSGTELPEAMELATDMVFITWITNKTIQDDGWTLDYTIDGVGVDENFSYDNLSIYPNPTSGQLQVAFDIEKSQSLEIQLMSINGQVIQKDIVNAFSGHYSKSFDLSDLAKGVYILSIISDNGKVDKKVVLK
ncbi:MAG: hypothetical protein DRI87_04565 [Bacteroidetes bacterium]|nr:MAG: hypothetical protein DRI87_04565 [Bacteroidota bacterium]